jgi:hypothetical protein
MSQTHESVPAMAVAYAEQAVAAGRKLGTQLDYSENSLMEVEVILNQLERQMESGGGGTNSIDETCKIWGSYIGEVVRRRFGGEWSIETYPGKQFATLTLSVGANKLFPTMKVHRRLTQGEADNVWSFYKMVKARLEASSQAGVFRVQ